MSFSINGLMVIPSEPKKQITKSESNTGYFMNFIATTQGKSFKGNPDFQYWNCLIWLPDDLIQKWDEEIAIPSRVLYIEHAVAISVPVLDGKYHQTKIKLDFNKTKVLGTPLWIKEE